MALGDTSELFEEAPCRSHLSPKNNSHYDLCDDDLQEDDEEGDGFELSLKPCRF